LKKTLGNNDNSTFLRVEIIRRIGDLSISDLVLVVEAALDEMEFRHYKGIIV